jgi:predicted Ser/Thr protein kinase
MSSFWREDTMLDIASNLTIHIIDESELEVGPQSRVLGRGAFSQVLLGRWAGQSVAVKCLYAFKVGSCRRLFFLC